MSVFDVRGKPKSVDIIRFSDNEVKGAQVASTLERSDLHYKRLEIRDSTFDGYRTGAGYVIVPNIDSAKNLIKALDKAIELGWLK